MRKLAACAAGCLLPFVSAQTYVVDANAGPGSHYTTIAAAVADVPDGATLLVRAGTYGAFATSKGLTILGDPGARLDASTGIVSIHQLGPQRRFVMRGVELVSGVGGLFSLAANAGPILLEFAPAAPAVSDFRIASCDRVQIRGLSLDNPFFVPFYISHSTVSLVDCDLRCAGTDLGIRQTGGVLQLAGCRVEGAGGIYPLWNSANAIGVIGQGRIEVRSSTIVGPPGGAAFAYAISGEGTAWVDNATVLQNVYQLSSPTIGNQQLLAAAFVDMASCTASTGPLGGIASASVVGPAGSVAVLLAGFPAPPVALAGVEHALWLDAGSALTMAVGSGSATGSYGVPAASWVVGVCIGWQGLAWDPSNGLQFSNADAPVHWQ